MTSKYLITLGLPLLVAVGASGETRRPNILLILTEDQGAQTGFVGTPGLQTPHMDSLARSGVYFNKAFVAYPVCSASKAALYTGLHSHTNGILNNTPNYHKPAEQLTEAERDSTLYRCNRIRDEIPTLVERLKAAGYYQGVTHKLHVAPAEKFPYDEFIRGQDGQAVAGFIARANKTGKPWFLLYNISVSHRPFPNSDRVKIRVKPQDVQLPAFLPDTPVVRQDWAEYLAAIEAADRLVGEGMEALRASGQEANTLVIFLGDHGPCFQHGKMTLYDFGLRTPMIIRTPWLRGGWRTDVLASELDLTPTLLDMLDLPPLPRAHGLTLRPVLEEQSQAGGHDFVFAEISNRGVLPNDGMQERSVFDGRWHLIYRENLTPPWRQVQADSKDWRPWGNRTYAETLRVKDRFPEQYRILAEMDPQSLGGKVPALELYDLQADPDEMHNLVNDSAAQPHRDRLYAALCRWVQETADPAVQPPPMPAEPAPSDGENRPGRQGQQQEPGGNRRRASADAQAMNVIFILADDLGWADTTLYGHMRLYETPNLERLAERGMVFTRAYANSPLCSPTRASIMTGQIPARHGSTAPQHHTQAVRLKASVTESAPPGNRALLTQSVTRLDTAFPTMAKLLKAQGYATGHFGKWHLGPEPYSPLQHGFDVDIPHHPGPGPAGSFVAPWKFKDFKEAYPQEHIEDRMAAEAVKWMQTVKGKPFYMNYWQFSVHAPFDAKAALIEKYKRKIDPASPQRCPTYAAMVESLDDAVGTLLDAVDAAGIADRTAIVFISDNGGNMYNVVDGERPTSNAPLRGGKATMFEGGIRVPCVVVWPGVTKPGSRSDEIIQTSDFYTTILRQLQIPLPKGHVVDGIDITPALQGNALDRECIITYFPHSPPVPDWLPPSMAVHAGDWKLIRLFHQGPNGAHGYLLYNLADDIGETRNLAASYPEKVTHLDRMMEEFIQEASTVVPQPNPRFDPAKYQPEKVGVPSASNQIKRD